MATFHISEILVDCIRKTSHSLCKVMNNVKSVIMTVKWYSVNSNNGSHTYQSLLISLEITKCNLVWANFVRCDVYCDALLLVSNIKSCSWSILCLTSVKTHKNNPNYCPGYFHRDTIDLSWILYWPKGPFPPSDRVSVSNVAKALVKMCYFCKKIFHFAWK